MTTRITNDTDEPITIAPGEAIDLGFRGDYATEEERTRNLDIVRITGRQGDR